jgi:capsular polysaccharide biosynthesis protein
MKRDQESMTTRDYLAIARRHWLIVLGVTVVVVGAAISWSAAHPRSYVAQTDVLVMPTLLDPSNAGTDAAMTAEEMATQVSVATSQPVLEAARKVLPGHPGLRKLEQAVSAQPVGQSQVVRISATASTPEAARAEARAVGTAFVNFRTNTASAQVTTRLASLRAQQSAARNRLAVVDHLLPQKPPNRTDLEIEHRDLMSQVATLGAQITALGLPSPRGGELLATRLAQNPTMMTKELTTGVLALVFGLFLGLLLAVVRDRTARTVRDESSLSRATGGAPVIGVVRRQPARVGPRELVTAASPLAEAALDYHGLAAQLRSIARRSSRDRTRDGLLVMVTATDAGHSRVARNLAVALACQGYQVIGVDCSAADDAGPDWPAVVETEPAPSVPEKIPALTGPVGADWGSAHSNGNSSPGIVGLGELLANTESPNRYVRPSGVDNLSVLPAGQHTGHPIGTFATPRLRQVVSDLLRNADVVIIDAPCSLAESAVQLSDELDVALIVATWGRSRTRELSRLTGRLRQLEVGTIASALVKSGRGH